MGSGFLGTPASLMLDVVVCSLALVIPALFWSIFLAKFRRNFALHKQVQLVLGIVLLIVVVLFEVDMRLQGGFWEMAKESSYYKTPFLRNLLWVHLVFSISTVFIWAATYGTALKFFPSPPRPGSFSPRHKVMAWVSVVDMVGTAVTGVMVYYYGFMN